MKIDRADSSLQQEDMVKGKKYPKTGRSCSFRKSLMENLGSHEKLELVASGVIQLKEIKESFKLPNSYYRLNSKPIEKSNAAREAKVRNLSDIQSDKVSVNILEGYALKAKLEGHGEGGYPFVYVEAKHDDGRVNAYQVEVCRIPKGSRDPVEQIAAEISERKEE